MRVSTIGIPTRSLLSLVIAATAAWPTNASAQVMYTIQDLGTLGGSNSTGAAINAAGQVTGRSTTASGVEHAFRTTATGLISDPGTDLGTLGGSASYGSGINDAGQVTGGSLRAGGGNQHAFRSSPNGQPVSLTDLGTLGPQGGFGSGGSAINAAGQVTGTSPSTAGGSHAFRTTATGLISDPGTDLGTLGGLNSSGNAINAAGQVTGSSNGHAFRTTAAGLISDPGTDLGTLGGSGSGGNAINAAGQVAGASQPPIGDFHAFRSSPNGQPVSLTDLGTLGGESSSAYSINALGVLVGSSDTVSGDPVISRAFVYDTQMRDLNALLVNGSGWVLENALGINDAGQIAGYGTFGGQTHAFRLTPTTVPEPSALALLGAAAVAGFTARKKRPIPYSGRAR